MASYLLDTNHLSPLVTLGHPLRDKVVRQLRQGDHFGLALPCLTELLYGIAVVPRSRQNLEEWHRLETAFFVYDIHRQDAEKAAALRVQLRRQGWQLETVDALIAAVALRYDLVLLTTDRDFQAIPGLPQENWLIL